MLLYRFLIEAVILFSVALWYIITVIMQIKESPIEVAYRGMYRNNEILFWYVM
jgi:hypothetical protein